MPHLCHTCATPCCDPPPVLQVNALEKEFACTATVVDDDDDNEDAAAAAGLSGRSAMATLCVEVAKWRSEHRLIRLRFRVSTSFACTVGAPEVEVRPEEGLF